MFVFERPWVKPVPVFQDASREKSISMDDVSNLKKSQGNQPQVAHHTKSIPWKAFLSYSHERALQLMVSLVMSE
jgi:hypothetical protein